MSNTFNTVPSQAPIPTQTHAEPFAQPHIQPPVAPSVAPPVESHGRTGHDEAGRVADVAADAAHRVADSGREGASRVKNEAKTQTQGLIDEARTQLTEQAGTQQARAAEGLHTLSDELSTMVRTSDSTGVAHDLVQQIATRTESISSWLGARDPAAVMQEVRGFARRKPGTFIALAVTAGVLAGRLTRNIVANESSTSPAGSTLPTGSTSPAGSTSATGSTSPTRDNTVTGEASRTATGRGAV